MQRVKKLWTQPLKLQSVFNKHKYAGIHQTHMDILD